MSNKFGATKSRVPAVKNIAPPAQPQGKVNFGLLLGLAVTILAALLGALTWPNHLELKLLDQRHRSFPVGQNHPDIAVIVIDDKSLEQIGHWPWPRRYLARLIQLCHQAGARQLLLDIDLPEERFRELILPGTTDVGIYEPQVNFVGEPQPTLIDNDAELTGAIDKAGNVILPLYAHLSSKKSTDYSDRANPELTARVMADLERASDPNFAAVFSRIWPEKDIQNVDEDYHELLLTFQWCRALRALRRFSFEREPEKIATPLYTLTEVTPPFLRFAEARLLNSGFVSVKEDSDGVVRRVPLLARYKDKIYKQISFAAVCDSLGVRDEDIDLSQPDRIVLRSPNIKIPLDESGSMIISWPGDWRDDLNDRRTYISVTSVARIWQMQQARQDNLRQLQLIDRLNFELSTVPDDLSALDMDTRRLIEDKRRQLAALADPNVLNQANLQLEQQIEADQKDLSSKIADKIVLLGSIATGEAGARDFAVTPTSELTPGIIVHRNIINTILKQTFIYRPSSWIEVCMVLFLGTLMTILTAWSRPLISGLAVTLLTGLTVGANFWLAFNYTHYFIAVVTPVVAILASFTTVTFYRQITEGWAKRRITARFKQYTSPAVVDKIVSSAGDVSLAGEMRELSCYFSDLAGFTSISEKLGPQKTVSVLNIYLDRMTEVLDRYYATINKFEGDGIFVFFGAPITLPDQSRSACLAALDAQQELAKLVQEQRRINQDFPLLQMRVGVSTGEVVVGDCGSQRRFDYTAIGDTVNFGARLESANKIFGTKILICRRTYEQATEAIEARYLGNVRVVGKETGVGVYELLGKAGTLKKEDKQYLAQFESAVRLFQDRQFDKARVSFEQYLRYQPADKTSLLYLNTLQQLHPIGPPDSFDGCIELTEK